MNSSDVKEEQANGVAQLRRFPGLRPYTAEDRALFFGRENEAENLYYSVSTNRVTLLYGQSGSGKSSLINCSLVPRLVDEGCSVVSIRLTRFPDDDSPGFAGSIRLAGSMQEVPVEIRLESKGSTSSARKLISIAKDAIAKSHPGEGDSAGMIVLLIDQFEEVFDKLAQPQQMQIMDFVADLRQERSPVWHLLLSLRSEYVGYLATLTEYIRGVFDSPIHVQPMGVKEAKRVLHRTARASRTGTVGSLDYELDSDPFILDERCVDLIVEECATNTDVDAVNLLLLQIIGRELVELFAKGFTENDTREIDSEKLTPAWFKETKTKNFEVIVEKALEKEADQRKAMSILERMVTDTGKRQIVRRSEIVSDDMSGAIVRSLSKNDIVREERVFSDRRYEITHDFVADVIWRKAQKRRLRKTVLQSTAGVTISLLAVLATVWYVQSKSEELNGITSELEVIQARLNESDDELREVLTSVELGKERVRELNESRDEQAAANCSLRHGLFLRDWQSSKWDAAKASLQRTLDDCRGSGAFSDGALDFLESVHVSTFATPAVVATPSDDPLIDARPSLFRDATTLITHELVPFNIDRIAGGDRYTLQDACNKDADCLNRRLLSGMLPVVLLDGSETLVRICGLADSDIRDRNPIYLTEDECSENASPFNFSAVSDVPHPLVARVSHKGADYFIIGREGDDIACGLDGSCQVFDGTENQRAMITALVTGSSVPVVADPDTEDSVIFVTDQDGFIYRYRIEYESCSEVDCPLPALRPEAHLEWFIRGHQSRINAIRLYDYNGTPALFTASSDGTVVLRDQRSLEMLQVFVGRGNESIEAVFTDSDSEGETRLIALGREWTRFEWDAERPTMAVHRVENLIPNSVTIAGRENGFIFVGGLLEPQVGGEETRWLPGIYRVANNETENCSLGIGRTTPERFLSVERMATSVDNSTVVAAMGNYRDNRGGLAVLDNEQADCRFQIVRDSEVRRVSGAFHDVDFAPDGSIVASDFRGSLWNFRRKDSEWEVNRRELFDLERQLTAIAFDGSRSQVHVGVRRRVADGQVDRGCLISMPIAALRQGSTWSACDDVVDGGQSLSIPESYGRLRWINVDEVTGRAALSGNEFVETVLRTNQADQDRTALLPDGIVTWRTMFSHGGDVLFGATFQGTVEVWDAQSSTHLMSIRLPVAIKSVNALLDMDLACSTDGDCRIVVPLKTERSVVEMRFQAPSLKD